MSDSVAGRLQPPERQLQQNIKVGVSGAARVTQCPSQTNRPGLGNSYGDLRHKIVPPDLPLRRGGSVDRVGESAESLPALPMARSTSVSTTDSASQFFYILFFNLCTCLDRLS